MKPPRDLSNQEIIEIARIIGEPTFKYMMKRIDKYILSNKKQYDISVNSFIDVFIFSVAALDANMLRWISQWFKLKIGKSIDEEKLRLALMKGINGQLGIETH
jgi:uncharacterized phage protein gp47/JayE